MTTPFEEGRTAGYRDDPARNPYRKGVEALMNYDAILWACAWECGYIAGQEQARADVQDKYREACR